MKLDEDLTDASMNRLHEVHADIEAKEVRARDVGDRTKRVGIVIAIVGAALALVIAPARDRGERDPADRRARGGRDAPRRRRVHANRLGRRPDGVEALRTI